jgi:hypothetical protein
MFYWMTYSTACTIDVILLHTRAMKSLNIPKWYWEATLRRTENAMPKGKRTKTNDVLKIWHRKLKIEHHEPHQTSGVSAGASDTRHEIGKKYDGLVRWTNIITPYSFVTQTFRSH